MALMTARVTVSDATAPFLLDAINNHLARMGWDPRMPDEVRALDELRSVAEKLRRAVA